MAVRKMTFSLPADLASKFVRQVAPRDRSKYLAGVLEQSLKRRERDLIRACRLANEDPDATAVEHEMDAVEDAIEEPWDASSSR